MSFNRNNYVTLENYNKPIKEKYGFSSYEIQKTTYPIEIKNKNQEPVLSNYSSSGVVSTNPAYNVGEQNPGLSWV
jgi:hypothetical protein